MYKEKRIGIEHPARDFLKHGHFVLLDPAVFLRVASSTKGFTSGAIWQIRGEQTTPPL
jgi:hypothetical protein